MVRLFHYDHCPYCVKVRAALGISRIKVQEVILLNDDEQTPISMVGQKKVPILEFESGRFMSESLDIISFLYKSAGKGIGDVTTDRFQQDHKQILSKRYHLAMPRWVQTDLGEFKTAAAQEYFKRKKEQYIGDFGKNILLTQRYITEIYSALEGVDSYIDDKEFVHGKLSFDDLHLFATLRSLSVVKDLKFTRNIYRYMKHIESISGVNLHFSIAI